MTAPPTLSQIGRMKAATLLASLEEGTDIYLKKPITRSEVNAYKLRVEKLRIPESNAGALANRDGVLESLQDRQAKLLRQRNAFRAVPMNDTNREKIGTLLNRLNWIGASDSAEYKDLQKILHGNKTKDVPKDATKSKTPQKTPHASGHNPYVGQTKTVKKIAMGSKLVADDTMIAFLRDLKGDPRFKVTDNFLTSLNVRLHEWIQTVVGFLPITYVPSREKGKETTQACDDEELLPMPMRDALKLASPDMDIKHATQEIETFAKSGKTVPKPNKTNLVTAVQFYARPLSKITHVAYQYLEDALVQYIIHVGTTLVKLVSAKGLKSLDACDPTTTAGQIPRNMVPRQHEAHADVMIPTAEGVVIQFIGDDSESAEEQSDEQTDSEEQSDEPSDEQSGEESSDEEELVLEYPQ